MPTYVLSYRNPKGYTPSAAWLAWFEGIGDRLVDIGKPVVGGAALGASSGGTEFGTFSVIRAADLEAAVTVAKGCPHLNEGDCGLPGLALRRLIGIWGEVSGLAAAADPLIGGAITGGLPWHWVFWVNVPVGVVAMIGARLRPSETRGPRTRLDIPVSAGTEALIWGVVQGPQSG